MPPHWPGPTPYTNSVHAPRGCLQPRAQRQRARRQAPGPLQRSLLRLACDSPTVRVPCSRPVCHWGSSLFRIGFLATSGLSPVATTQTCPVSSAGASRSPSYKQSSGAGSVSRCAALAPPAPVTCCALTLPRPSAGDRSVVGCRTEADALCRPEASGAVVGRWACAKTVCGASTTVRRGRRCRPLVCRTRAKRLCDVWRGGSQIDSRHGYARHIEKTYGSSAATSPRPCDNHFVAHFGPERGSHEDRALLLLCQASSAGEDGSDEELSRSVVLAVPEPRRLRPCLPPRRSALLAEGRGYAGYVARALGLVAGAIRLLFEGLPRGSGEGSMSKGLVRCPCGQPEAVICAHCFRSCCAEHHAFTPTGEPGALEPACFPRCDAKWWKMARVDAYAAKMG
jgi:hypothetical protein